MAGELMWLRCTDATGPREWVSLADLVDLLRPLLAQPVPADAEAELARLRRTKEIADNDNIGLLAQVRSFEGEFIRLDTRCQRAELQLAEAQQANAMLTAQLAEAQKAAQGWEFQWKMERGNAEFWHKHCDEAAAWRDSLAQRPQVADANFWRAAFEDAKRDADQLRERVAELEAIIDLRERQNVTLMRAIEGMADSRDRLAAQVATATAERDEARRVATQHAEKLEAIPWEGLAAWATLARADSPVRKWLNANRPTEANN